MNLSIVVPQIFYDIIARIIPGLIILGVGSLIWPGEHFSWERVHRMAAWFNGTDSHPFFVTVSMLLASYFISTVLEGLWGLPELFRHDKPRSVRSNRRCALFLLQSRDERAKARVERAWKSLEYGPIPKLDAISMMYDELRSRNPQAGARTVKLRAESHGYRRLILGLACCLLLNFGNFGQGQNMTTVAVGGVLLFMWIGVAAVYLYRAEEWYRSVCTNWLLTFRHPASSVGISASRLEKVEEEESA